MALGLCLPFLLAWSPSRAGPVCLFAASALSHHTHPERGPMNSVQGGVPEAGGTWLRCKEKAVTAGPVDSHQRDERTTYL